MRKQTLWRGLAAGLLVVTLPAVGAAQTEFGNIRGTVVDATGTVLSGVSVTLSDPLVLAPRTVATAPTGSYLFPALVPGTYELTFVLSGFQTLRHEAVNVLAGQTTSVNVPLDIAGTVESVTVVANTSEVDVRSTNVAVNLDSGLLTGVPAARDMWSTLQTQAPGVVQESEDVGGSGGGFQRAFQAHGTSLFLNTVTLNGANVTDPVGAIVLYPDPDSLAEMQVSTAAHPVEVAAPGVHVNLVTKSGGDTFSGGIGYYYRGSAFSSTNIDDALRDLGVVGGSSVRRLSDFTADIGGPIVVDKLRFYASWRDYQVDRDILNFPVQNETHIYGGLANVSYQINPSNRVRGLVSVQPLTHSRRFASASFAPEATWFQDDVNRTYQLVWSSVLGSNTLLDVRTGYVPYDFRLKGQQGSTLPANFDLATGFASRAFPFANFDILLERFTTNASVNHLASGASGDHNLRLGFEYQRNLSDTLETRNGDVITFTFNGSPAFVNLYDSPLNTLARSREVTLYGSDSWSPQNRLTINLGARLTASRGFTPAQGNPANQFFPARSFEKRDLISWNSVAPRLGVIYDVSGTGTAAVKVSYNRYAHPLHIFNVGGANPNVRSNRVPLLER